MSKRVTFWRSSTLFACVVALGAISGVAPAQANDVLADDVLKALSSLPERTGVFDGNIGDSPTANVPAGQTVKFQHSAKPVSLPEQASHGINLAFDQPINLGLPFAAQAVKSVYVAPGIRAYDNHNSSVTVPIAKNDGSVQITTILEDRSAPTRFTYRVNTAGAVKLVEENGFVAMKDPSGKLIGGFAPAWAFDASGKAVPTKYEINGNTITQVVEHRTAANVTYPVVADPYAGKQLLGTITYAVEMG